MKIITILLALLLLATTAEAAPAKPLPCPTADQANADSALKLGAILRITGLTCHGGDGSPLYPTYQIFTRNNGPLLKTYQDQLLASYRQSGKKDPEKALHTRETELENEQSLAAAKAGMQSYCGEYVPQLQSAAVASRPQITRMIQALADASRPKNCAPQQSG